ncbi:hypothetical protein B0O99DRAFT_680211 [Bisporella sp. PMI_857]|nr:hypothetical protein B0O99DRAFT_680211 [Bisporella sp. PMI_857]
MNTTTYSAEYLAETKQDYLRRLDAAIITFAIVFVAARIFIRQRWGTGISADDWVLVVSAVFFIAVAVSNVFMINHGMGLHLAVVSADDFSSMLQSLMVSECTYAVSIALTKISILLMYCRVFPVKSMKKGAAILGCLTIAWAIATLVPSIFQCTPIKKAWLPTLPYGNCINLKAWFIGSAAPNILTDIAILMLPIPQIWKLHMSVSKKISITIVFLLGSFVVAASIYRLFALLTFDPSDFTYSTSAASAWSVVEVAAGLVSACLPTFGPVFQLLKQKFGIQTILSSKRKSVSEPIGLVTIGGGRWKNSSKGFNNQSRPDVENFVQLKDGRLSKYGIEIQKENVSVGCEPIEQSEKGDSGDELPLYKRP